MQQQQKGQTTTGAKAGAGGGGGGATNTATGVGGGSGSGAGNSSRVSPIPGSCVYTHTAAVFCLHQPFTPRNILEKEDEIWFRDFGFGRVQRRLGVCCSAFRYLQIVKEGCYIDAKEQQRQKEQQQQRHNDATRIIDDETGCCCVIDSGFSLTHVVPTVDARAIVSNHKMNLQTRYVLEKIKRNSNRFLTNLNSLSL